MTLAIEQCVGRNKKKGKQKAILKWNQNKFQLRHGAQNTNVTTSKKLIQFEISLDFLGACRLKSFADLKMLLITIKPMQKGFNFGPYIKYHFDEIR